MSTFYRLNGDTPEACTPDQWSAYIEGNPARDIASEKIGDAYVSSRFVGIDTRAFPEGPPRLWQTTVFALWIRSEISADECPQTIPSSTLSSNPEEALRTHREIVERVREYQASMGQRELGLEAS